MYKIFILFLLPSSQRRPMKANAGQRRPTQAHEGPQQPTTANEGQRRPMKAHSSQRRPTKAHGSQRRPTAANDGQRRPMQAHEDKKGPNNAIWRRLGPRYVFFFIFFILFLLLRDSGHPTRTRTPRNPYPGTRVRVFWGTGTGSPGKPQGYPCQSLVLRPRLEELVSLNFRETELQSRRQIGLRSELQLSYNIQTGELLR